MKTLALLVLPGIFGCARADSPRGTGDTTAASAGVTASGQQPDTIAGSTTAREIYIDSVTAANPLIVFGRARTFENTVQVRVADSQGAAIAETHTTSVGEMGHHNPFKASLWVTRAPGDSAIVEAFEYSAKDGSVRSLTADTVPYAVASNALTLVFPAGDCTRTASFTRAMPKSAAVARLLAEALVAGPTDAEKAAGATHVFPRGSGVNSVVLRGGELTVDFNDRLQNVGGSCAAEGIRAAVTQTLEKLSAVRRVVITAGGSRDLALQP